MKYSFLLWFLLVLMVIQLIITMATVRKVFSISRSVTTIESRIMEWGLYEDN